MTEKKLFMSLCSTAVLIGALSVVGAPNARGTGYNVEMPEFGTGVTERKHSRGHFRGQGLPASTASTAWAGSKHSRGHFRGQGAKEIQHSLALTTSRHFRGRGG